MDTRHFAGKIDHTLLNPDLKTKDIEKLCEEAAEFNFASVCVPPCWVTESEKQLRDTEIKVCTVAGFPMGYSASEAKIIEVRTAVEQGAEEIDMVINISFLKNANLTALGNEIFQAARICRASGAVLKVIVETCLLSYEEKILAARIACDNGAHYIKTSTGYSHSGVSIDDIVLFKHHFGNQIKIKASGGIKSLDFALRLIDNGADRIGTSSAISLMNEFANYNRL